MESLMRTKINIQNIAIAKRNTVFVSCSISNITSHCLAHAILQKGLFQDFSLPQMSDSVSQRNSEFLNHTRSNRPFTFTVSDE